MRFGTQDANQAEEEKEPVWPRGFRAVESACRAGSNKLLARETDHKPDRGVNVQRALVSRDAAGWSRLWSFSVSRVAGGWADIQG